MGFVNILNEAVKGKKISDDVPASPIIDKLMKLIEKLSSWVDSTPAIDQPQRFGNKAFRTWWEKIRDVSTIAYSHRYDLVISKYEGGGGYSDALNTRSPAIICACYSSVVIVY